MVRCCVLTVGVLAVVAAFAIRGNALVIKHPSRETVGVMARPAILGGRYMIR